jgi:hypothetical protein
MLAESKMEGSKMMNTGAPLCVGNIQKLPEDYTRAARKMGSVRNAQVNYTQDMKYFEGADHHQVRSGVHNEAKMIQDTTDRDLLQTKNPQWNTSVGIVGHPNEKSDQHKLFDIKTGLADEKPHKP